MAKYSYTIPAGTAEENSHAGQSSAASHAWQGSAAPGRTGPSAWQAWTLEEGVAPVRLLPSAANETLYGLLDIPHLVRGATTPKFSLVLLLSRAPVAGEASVRPLLMSGYLGMELDYHLPAALAQKLHAEPLFARQAQLTLSSPARSEMAAVRLGTPLLRGALHSNLSRDETLAVLDALDGSPCALELRAHIEFRASAPGDSFPLDSFPARQWAKLKSAVADGGVTEAAVRPVFDKLDLPNEAFAVFLHVCRSVLTSVQASTDSPEAPGTVDDAEPTLPTSSASQNGRAVRKKGNGTNPDYPPTSPLPSDGASATEFISAWHRDLSRYINLRCTLDAVLGSALGSADRAACVRIVGPSGDLDGGPQLENLERRMSRAMPGSLGQGAMVAGNQVQTVAATLKPSLNTAATSHLMASQAIRIDQPMVPAVHTPVLPTQEAPTVAQVTPIAHYALPQAVFLTADFAPLSLPVITDLNAALLADKVNPNLRWYLPLITLVRPAPNEAPDTSPFLFELERVGTGASGRPAIRARLRFTFELGRSGATAAAVAALGAATRVAARMIEPLEPSVSLSVPYIDEASGKLMRASYRGVTTRSGNRLVTTVELQNDAARTTYGALSTAGFQSELPRLEVAFQFSGYAPVLDRPPLVVGGKISNAVLLQSTRDDGQTILVSAGGRNFAFRPALAERRPASALLMASSQNLSLGGRITTSEAALQLESKVKYAQRTTIRQQQLDAFFSCAELGAFYREKQETATVSIGCAEAFRLGQASSRTYQEMVALNHPSYRVFRNLQQPGRFLLLPSSYQITRYSPGVAEREYRPALLVYAALDADDPENNRIRFEAMLGPTITPYDQQELHRRLLAEAQNPVIELPNMLTRNTEFRWNVTTTPAVEAVTSATPDCLHTALTTDIASALLLKTLIQNTGLTGEARFTFDDGSVLTSSLCMGLRYLTGPSPEGPLTLKRQGDTIQLTNHIEGSLAVKDVVLFDNGGTPVRVPVEQTLAPAASLDVATPGDWKVSQADFELLADGHPGFEEVRAMIEEIQCNVVFVDLVNYENHGLTRVDIDARLQGVPGVSRVPMDQRRGAVNFLLPLTTYLESRVVEYQVTKVYPSRPAEQTGWLAWDMAQGSNIVSVTAEKIFT